MNARMSTTEEIYDVLIVGAGPVGLACGIAARRVGLSHLIVEKGCIVDSVYRFPAHMTFFTTSRLLEIGDHPMVCLHGKPKRGEALEYYRSVARVEKLAIRTFEEVISVTGEKDAFVIATQGRDDAYEHRARRVVLATGYYDHPNLLGVPGEDLPNVSHYYTDPHRFFGERVLVVGGRNSASEAVLELYRHDAEVTLVHRGEALGETVKYWVKPDVENRIADGDIRAHFETTIVEAKPRSAVLRSNDGSKTWEEPFDQIFLLTGYHPNPELLARCGITPAPETLQVTLHPETNETRDVPGLYCAGSVSAGYATGNVFIENGRLDSIGIFEHIAKTLG